MKYRIYKNYLKEIKENTQVLTPGQRARNIISPPPPPPPPPAPPAPPKDSMTGRLGEYLYNKFPGMFGSGSTKTAASAQANNQKFLDVRQNIVDTDKEAIKQGLITKRIESKNTPVYGPPQLTATDVERDKNLRNLIAANKTQTGSTVPTTITKSPVRARRSAAVPVSFDDNLVSNKPMLATQTTAPAAVIPTLPRKGLSLSQAPSKTVAATTTTPISTVTSATAPAMVTNYTVKKGDNIWNIAKGILTSRNEKVPSNSEILAKVKEVARLNNIENPDKIYPGQKIVF